MKSNDLSAVDTPQLELGLRRAPKPDKSMLSLEVIKCQPSMMAATKLGIAAAGLDDKEVYLDLGIDPGHFSRIKSGKAHFNPDLYPALFGLTGNQAALIWLANHEGYNLVPQRSSVEQQLEASERENEELRLKLRHFEEFMGLKKNV